MIQFIKTHQLRCSLFFVLVALNVLLQFDFSEKTFNTVFSSTSKSTTYAYNELCGVVRAQISKPSQNVLLSGVISIVATSPHCKRSKITPYILNSLPLEQIVVSVLTHEPQIYALNSFDFDNLHSGLSPPTV